MGLTDPMATPALVEIRQWRSGVRIWRRRDGTWLPPQNAHDRAWRAAAVVPATSGDWLAAIETRQQALVRLYRWQEATDRSHHATSVLLPAQSSRPLGIILNDQPALVCIGQGDAELRVFPTGDDGSWQAPLAFPFPTGVTALARIGTAAQPTLLAWRQEAGDLLASTWDGKRFAYPQPLALPAGVPADAKLLGFDSIDATAWGIWGNDQGLYRATWEADSTIAHVTEFPGNMGKITTRWLGRTLIQAKGKVCQRHHFINTDN